MERKRARGDVRRRGLLQEFLPARCSQRCWLPVPADPAALTDCVPASPWQHNFQQLRSRSRTKEKSTARCQGPFPLKPTGATLATGEGCCWLADFGEKKPDGLSPPSKSQMLASRCLPLGRKGHNPSAYVRLVPRPCPTPRCLLARCTGDLR